MQKYLVARDRQGQYLGAAPLTGTPATIGRAHGGSTLVLPSTAVSRTHASAYIRPDGAVVLNDEGSANGVLVDGQRIGGPTLVDESNTIEISEFVLRVECEQQPAAPAVPMQQHAPEVEEMPTMLEPYAGAAQALANTSLQLVGRGGRFDGTIFNLDKPLIFVGRTEENDLPLNDPSISRRHAQIRIATTGDRFTLLDLRSSNRTFVDGELIKRAECGAGSVVRFGELVFRVDCEHSVAPVRKANKQRSGKILVLAAAMVLLVLGVVGAVGYATREKPPPPKVITAEERLRQIQADVQRFVDEGKRRITLKEWSEAVSAFDKALAKDPINGESTKLRKKALYELENEKIYEKGLKFFSLGTEENLIKARQVFRKVGDKSIYLREVRYKIKTINERLADKYRTVGLSNCKARYWVKCQAALCRFFQLIPADKAVPGEANVRTMLTWVEKKLRRRRGFKACAAPRYHNPVEQITSADPQKLLNDKYKLPHVAELLTIYIQGKITEALKKLAILRGKKSMRPHKATLAEINRQFNVIKGKFEEGYGAFRGRKADQANKHWSLVLEADKALLPPGIESFHRREIARFLGDLYFELGDEQYKLGRFRQAGERWFKGVKASPKHQKILNGLLQLEKEAEKVLQAGKSLAAQGNVAGARTKLNLAKELSAEKSTIHQEALKALKALGN